MSSSNCVRKIAHDLNVDRTEDIKIEEDITFDGLLLSKNIIEGLTKCGFFKPSPIQLKAIPLGKCGFDLIVEAKSGTGKTAVFSVIALESIMLELGCQCIVVAPTREIAVQIQQVISSIGSSIEGLAVELAMGGTNFAEDVERLSGKKYQIIIGTPGRLKHFIKEKVICVDSVRLFVLDEADRLMETGFQNDINYIFSSLPERKQVIVASATYPSELGTFLTKYMRSPSHINPYNTRILLGVSQHVSIVKSHFNKVRQNQILMEEVKRILSNVEFKQCLIFCNYQATTTNTWRHLCTNGWPAEYLCSTQSQENRLKSLSKLQSFECRILVATDLASRGLDAANVDLVINLETPYDLATYLHRIGRCGRFGSWGKSVTILPEKEEQKFMNLLEKFGDSFDLKPVTYLIDDKINNLINAEHIKTEFKHEETNMDVNMIPIFKENKTVVDEILNSFHQDSIDMLLDPDNEYNLDDYYSTFMKVESEEDIVPEFDCINHLKKTVPDYDKITKYIEKNFICDDDMILDRNENIITEESNIQQDDNIQPTEDISIDLNVTKNTFSNNTKKNKPKNNKQHGKKNRENSTEGTKDLEVQYDPTNLIDVEDNTTQVFEIEESEDDDSDLEVNSNEEYLRWREQLSAMSAYIQQQVYLQTLTMLNDMEMTDS